MSQKSTQKLVTDFKEKYKKEAEKLVNDVFPNKMIELDELFRSKKLSLSRTSDVCSDLKIPVPDPILFTGDSAMPHPSKKRKADSNSIDDISGTKVMILPNGPVPTNQQLQDLVNLLKPYIQELVDHANMVKMWISFLIPKIEDGNNFGVSIQEDTMAEARQIETEAASYLDQISRYFITRGKLVSKVAKYPHIDDYRQSVREVDEKEFISLRLICCELRNHYASLHDLIHKNIDKIKKPRSANAENLY
ncbi:proteasome activator complex subunit 3-like [Liolophura sinensis]|uniref:proteasome activator complex subunit 3-like n=1 Tax=Liolophura sinensis TaxID=3198878 RepID=UPI003158FCAC